MQYAFDGVSPEIHPDAFVCDEATLLGDVTVGPRSSVWPGAVLRGDLGPVRVGEQSHVEDNTVLHQSSVGDRVMVGHAAVINSASVGSSVLVGMNATINRGAQVGDRCVVAPNAVVPQDREVPSDSLVMGVPADVTPFAQTEYDAESILETYSPDRYLDIARRHSDLFGHE
ncbi:MAG: gamma carbonic anhydrase family protein [Haloplanus sp.]|jgi:carbonic anhydrase/acetyltransferase-like protein (isoleucine patch superfamily)